MVENYFLILFEKAKEEIEAEAIGPKTIRLLDPDTNKIITTDISNFIFANSNGGVEPVTLYGIRQKDSKTGPSKKAGDEMVINGRVSFKYTPKGGGISSFDSYKYHNNITLEVSSVDGVPYPRKEIRRIKADSLNKISVGGKVYKILR